MKNRFTSWSLLLFMLALSACAPPAEEGDMGEEAMAEAVQSVSSLRDEYQAAYNAGDAAKAASLFTEDAIMAAPGQEAVNGSGAIQDHLRSLFEQRAAQISISSSETKVVGDWGYDFGTATVTFTPREGGESIEDEGHYIVIVQKVADGWKIARAVANSHTAPVMEMNEMMEGTMEGGAPPQQ